MEDGERRRGEEGGGRRLGLGSADLCVKTHPWLPDTFFFFFAFLSVCRPPVFAPLSGGAVWGRSAAHRVCFVPNVNLMLAAAIVGLKGSVLLLKGVSLRRPNTPVCQDARPRWMILSSFFFLS